MKDGPDRQNNFTTGKRGKRSKRRRRRRRIGGAGGGAGEGKREIGRKREEKADDI